MLEGLAAYADMRHWNVEKENYEGMRVSFGEGEGDGWFLLRMSLHDPLMALNMESDVAGGVHLIAAALYAFLSHYDALDTRALAKI